ncbi:MAG: hypothetical protein KDJ88_21375, partial [Bauldia sp.]|nr:hypothetical protein [Bauldia sp.]
MTMKLTGYSDRWSVRPGETMTFHVHSVAPTYRAQLVRLIHGDENPYGPGFKEIEVASALDGSHEGAPRTIRKGSYGVVAQAMPAGDFSIEVWIWSTLPGPGRQGIMVWTSGDTSAFGLFLGADGHLELGGEGVPVVRSLRALAPRQWYRATVAVSAGSVALSVTPKIWLPESGHSDRVEAKLAAPIASGDGRLLFAAGRLEETADGPSPREVFNGKLARPRILDAGGPTLAAWDFFQHAGKAMFAGVSGGADGRTVNRPARLMTGPGWPGATDSTMPLADTHDAIHFHDDDVADVGWPVSHDFVVPDDLPSGVYALRLTSDADEDYLPFFVCPPKTGGSPAPLAVLMPTMSYLAYANESLDVSDSVQVSPRQDMTITPERYAYVAENGLKSLYDNHRDGSGIAYGSRRRPIIDFRPKARCRTFDAPHQFAAD